MVVRPDHQGPRVPFRIEADFHLRAENIVVRRHKKQDGRGAVNRPIKWIDEPIGLLTRTNREFAASLNVPGYRRILPGKTAGQAIDGGLLNQHRSHKHKKNDATYSRLKVIHGITSLSFRYKINDFGR